MGDVSCGVTGALLLMEMKSAALLDRLFLMGANFGGGILAESVGAPMVGKL